VGGLGCLAFSAEVRDGARSGSLANRGGLMSFFDRESDHLQVGVEALECGAKICV
jgi:hypothetical protein